MRPVGREYQWSKYPLVWCLLHLSLDCDLPKDHWATCLWEMTCHFQTASRRVKETTAWEAKYWALNFLFVYLKRKKNICIYDSRRRCKMKTVFSNSYVCWDATNQNCSPPNPCFFYFLFLFFWKGRDDPAEFWSVPIAAFSKSQSQQ